MYKKRSIFANIWKKIDSHEILLLNGARQVGKTTLMKMIEDRLLKDKGVKKKNIFWFDLERAVDLEIWSKEASALASIAKDSKEKQYIFIDEFQNSKTIGSILKVIHDHYPQFKVIITGSATWYLNINESLAGRKRVFSIWPLSFEEYIDWKESNEVKKYYTQAQKDIINTPHKIINIINESYIDFVKYGGYPAVVIAPNEEEKIHILSELLNSYLTRDIKIWNYKVNTIQMKNILTLLASQVGSLLEVNNLSLNTGLGRTALLNRLDLLQNTFILHLSKPFSTNKVKEISKNPKTFLVDTGLRNLLLDNFSVIKKTKDFGHIAENFIVTELHKQSDELDKIYFWRTVRNQEVDVIKKRENILTPIEIKSGNENKIPEGLKLFINNYNPKTAYVLNYSITKEESYKNTKVYFQPLWTVNRL